MGQWYGTGGSGPLTVTARVPGTCVLARGATTAVPLTITDNGTSTSAATVMRSFAGPAGISGTYTYWDVPALAPGTSWTTTLTVTVDAAQADTSAWLRVDYGSGFRMVATVVA